MVFKKLAKLFGGLKIKLLTYIRQRFFGIAAQFLYLSKPTGGYYISETFSAYGFYNASEMFSRAAERLSDVLCRNRSFRMGLYPEIRLVIKVHFRSRHIKRRIYIVYQREENTLSCAGKRVSEM